jgi:trehalose 6-phosphate phosphatase
LKVLSGKVDLPAFFGLVRRADKRVLLLDYDGTLAPFTIRRDEAVPYPAVRELLKEILPLHNTRTVIISGRAIKDLEELVGLDPLPELWGSHGWEHQSRDRGYWLSPLDQQSTEKLRQARRVLDQLNHSNLSEIKPVSVAAHWRGLPPQQVESMRIKILSAWSKIVENSNLEIHPFDGGLELRVKGRDKGSAVAETLSNLSGTVAAAYLGDDVTDEDAFKAMTGKGLRVLVREALRETLADVWVKPPEELLEFLRRWKDACAAESGR